MAAVLTILKILLVLVSIALIVLVMMQESKEDGLSSSIAGGYQGGENFMSKNSGRTKEGKLKKYTTIGLIVFCALALALNILG